MKNYQNFKGFLVKTANSSENTRKKYIDGFKRSSNVQFATTNNITQTPLQYVDPLFDTTLLMFPEDNLKEVNKRLRHYYKFQPIFGNCIDIHSTFPLSDFELMVDNEEVKEYYTYLKDKYNLIEMSEWALRDRNLLGESFFIGNWDTFNLEWKEWVHYPPEYVDVKTVPGTNEKLYSIMPDPEVKKVIGKRDETSEALEKVLMQYNKEYYRACTHDSNYVIENDRILEFSNRQSGYTLRGFSLGKRVLKDLMYEDKLRLLQFTFCDRHLFPIKIFKLGIKEKGWIPPKRHFEEFKQLLVQASNDPDFSLIYHTGLEVDYVGTKDKIEDLKPHFDHIEKRIMIGLFANQALIGGESPGYSSQTVNLRMLMHRYMTIREKLENTYREKIFLPIAREQGFIKQYSAEKANKIKIISKTFPTKRYYLPNFLWRKLNLLNSTAEQDLLMRLYDSGDIPFGVLSDVFGFDINVLNNYRNKEIGTYNDRITRNLIDKKIQEDPNLAFEYVKKENPFTILEKSFAKKDELAEAPPINSETEFGGGGMVATPTESPTTVTEETEEVPSPAGATPEEAPPL